MVPVSETTTYRVPGIHCEHCARAIREELSAIEGVESIEVDVAARTVAVRGAGLPDGDVREAIARAGYEAR